MKVDLHIHTSASDGCWDPKELIDEVRRAGISLFSATDHDSVGSIKELVELAPKAGLNFIKGVEITSKDDDHICHILGYGIDPASPSLLKIYKENTQRMQDLNIQQMKRLKDSGMDVDIDEFCRYKLEKGRGGGLVMNFLLDKGFFKTFEEALGFVIKKVDWSTPDYPSPSEVVSYIKDAGGHPILAHPGSTLIGNGLTDSDLERLIDMGIEGLECYTSYHNGEMTEKFLKFCRKRDLLITAGSDCHGPVLKARVLGEPETHLKDLNLKGIWHLKGKRYDGQEI